MDKLVKSLLLGIAAGIVSVIPMLLQAVSWQVSIGTVLHWLALGIIITFARLPMFPWLSGATIALLTSIPLALIVSETDAFTALLTIASSAVLGALLGLISDRLIVNPPRQ